MKKVLSVYQYVAPAVLAPLSFFLWYQEYSGNLKLVAVAWLVPILWAYIVPGIGTNVLKMWEFDARLRLGRFRIHHGFVFGSATATIAWLLHRQAADGVGAILLNALVVGSVLGFWNLLYDIKALESGILRVYNQPWAEGKSPADIALDYAPWFFGGFGAIYGAGMAWVEQTEKQDGLATGDFTMALVLITVLSCVLPTAGYMVQSVARHGHWGTRPVAKKCQSV